MNKRIDLHVGKKLLIVEDEIIVADDIASLAKDRGYEVLEPVFDYFAAVQAFQNHIPDLVILDIRLQGNRTGIEFAKWLRKHARTPIIYLTVFDNQKVRQLAQATSPVAYILKPFLKRELVSALDQALIA